MRVSIEMVYERYGRTSVKEQIQLTAKVFIASEKENRFNPGWIHPSSQRVSTGRKLARTCNPRDNVTPPTEHNHGMSHPQTHIWQRMDYITATQLRMQYQAGDETMSWRGDNLKCRGGSRGGGGGGGYSPPPPPPPPPSFP